MKKISMLLIVFTYVFIISCSAENDKAENDKLSAIEEVKNEKSASAQRIMYNLLKPEEKQLLWTQKIDVILGAKNLNVEQVKLLAEVKSYLTVEYFNNQIVNDQKEIIKVYYMKNFLKKAQKLFTTEFIYYNFFTINTSESSERAAPLDDYTNCGCHIGTLWTCGVVSPVTCKTPDNACRETPSGCGLWYDYSCNGECRS